MASIYLHHSELCHTELARRMHSGIYVFWLHHSSIGKCDVRVDTAETIKDKQTGLS